MAGRVSRVYAAVLVLALALSCATSLVAGETWIVGDDKGWSFGVAGWENGKAFHADDVLEFKYDSTMHNVVEVDEAGYNGCSAAADAKTYNSGDDKITLAAGKTFYICSFPSHCENGMKIAVATT